MSIKLSGKRAVDERRSLEGARGMEGEKTGCRVWQPGMQEDYYGIPRAAEETGMLSVATKYFGILPCREEGVFEFPRGLPAFENEKRFVLIELPENSPLVFLQSLAQPTLCFLAFPILVVDGEYRLAVSADDLAALDLDQGRQPDLGGEVLVLALVSLHDGFSATANLMAPVVLNLKTRHGLQAIRQDRLYSHRHLVDSRSPEVPSPEVPC